MQGPGSKPLVWVASSKRDLCGMPAEVQDVFGYALHLAQMGSRHPAAKAMRGFGSAAVLEVVEDWDGNSYRAVYTVRFADTVYVLHCFQKKSRKGAETPRPDMDTIRERFKAVVALARGVSK